MPSAVDRVAAEAIGGRRPPRRVRPRRGPRPPGPPSDAPSASMRMTRLLTTLTIHTPALGVESQAVGKDAVTAELGDDLPLSEAVVDQRIADHPPAHGFVDVQVSARRVDQGLVGEGKAVRRRCARRAGPTRRRIRRRYPRRRPPSRGIWRVLMASQIRSSRSTDTKLTVRSGAPSTSVRQGSIQPDGSTRHSATGRREIRHEHGTVGHQRDPVGQEVVGERGAKQRLGPVRADPDHDARAIARENAAVGGGEDAFGAVEPAPRRWSCRRR